MAEAEVRTDKVHRFGSTLRRDAWWLELLPVRSCSAGSAFMRRYELSKAASTNGGHISRPSIRL